MSLPALDAREYATGGNALAQALSRAMRPPKPEEERRDVYRAAVAAIALAPDEPRYQYHLGLALHHAHELPAAIDRYRAARAAAMTGDWARAAVEARTEALLDLLYDLDEEV